MKEQKKKVTKAMIYRSVASSTAIETGASVETIERKLKAAKKQKHFALALAN